MTADDLQFAQEAESEAHVVLVLFDVDDAAPVKTLCEALAGLDAALILIRRHGGTLSDEALSARLSEALGRPAPLMKPLQTPASGALALAPADAGVGLVRSLSTELKRRLTLVVLARPQASDAELLSAVSAAGGLSAALGGDGQISHAADLSGTTEALAERLRRLVPLQAEAAEVAPLDQLALAGLADTLRRVIGVDFRHYKSSTLSRRIRRRMRIEGVDSVEDYRDRLEQDEEACRRLTRDLLIGVTRFFRDPEAFDALSRVALEPLVEAAAEDRPVRVWVAGCGAGQEAYSVAMLLAEACEARGKPTAFHVFATDLDEAALRRARRGVYPGSIGEEVPLERLERFFERVRGGWRVRKTLRARVTFSRHDLTADPPFGRMDLVCCRNLLIYLGPHLQKKLISLFHYALRPGGYLFLGASETVAGHGDLFSVADARARIARRRETEARPPGGEVRPLRDVGWRSSETEETADLGAMTQRILLDEFAPPYAVVSNDGQLRYLSPGAGEFLGPPKGAFVNDVLRMTEGALRTSLRSALSEARKRRRTAVRDTVLARRGGAGQALRLTVQPMPAMGLEDGLHMVVLQPLGAVAVEARGAEDEAAVEQLERELRATRDELERALQEVETANEELKASNEELLSMNEELQSANEELEASKEELEASSAAIQEGRADLEALLHSTQIATLFLDAEGRVRRFTPEASRFFNLRPGDEGRPLSDVTHRFGPDEPPLTLEPDPDGEPREREIALADGGVALCRVTPYIGGEGLREGVVVTFLDISRRAKAEADRDRAKAELAARLAEIESLYADAPVGLCLLDPELRWVRINNALAEINGLPAEAHLGRSVRELLPTLADAAEAVMRQIVETGEPYGPFELVGETPSQPGVERVWREVWSPVKAADGRLLGVNVAAVEITDEKRAAAELAASDARLRLALASAEAGAFELDLRNGRNLWSEETWRLHGLEPAAEPPAFEDWLTRCVHPEDREALQREFGDALERGATDAVFEYRIVRNDGDTRWIASRARFDLGDGLGTRFSGISMDITERRRAQEALAESERRYRLALSAGQSGAWSWDVSKDRVIWSPELSDLLGLEQAEAPTNLAMVQALIAPEDHDRVEAYLDGRVRSDATDYAIDFRMLQADGTPVWLRAVGEFEREPATGEALSLRGVVQVIEEAKRAQAALAENEARLQRLLDNLFAFVAVLTPEGVLTYANAAPLEAGGLKADDVMGRLFWDCAWWTFDDAVRERIRAACAAAAAGETPRFDVEAAMAGGERMWIDFQIAPLYGEDGRVRELVPSAVDITERRRGEQHRELLVEELNHRVKNSLATIQAVASHTLRETPEPDAFRKAFLGRLHAIAAAHSLISATSWSRAPLRDLIEAQVQPYAPEASRRVRLDGEAITLGPSQAHALGLVLHELATNASKYGALAGEEGIVEISWRVDRGRLSLDWRERDGPPVRPPDRFGFGGRLIRQSVSHGLGGEAHIEYLPEGVRARFSLPM